MTGECDQHADESDTTQLRKALDTPSGYLRGSAGVGSRRCGRRCSAVEGYRRPRTRCVNFLGRASRLAPSSMATVTSRSTAR